MSNGNIIVWKVDLLKRVVTNFFETEKAHNYKIKLIMYCDKVNLLVSCSLTEFLLKL